MNKQNIVFFLICVFTIAIKAQTITGKWKTIDDTTGEAKSIIEIYEQNDKIYAKINELLVEEDKGKVCENCTGKNKNKPIIGMVIVNGLVKDNDEWNGGKILDPKNGKEYKCYLSFVSENKLKVRGFIGFSLLGRTQYWYKID